MEISRHIDWLSFTVPQSVDYRDLFPLLEWRFVARGMHGYRARFQNPQTNATLDTDSPDASMGHHFTFSGDALAILRQQQGAQDTQLCSRLLRFGAKSSRADLTINIHGGVLTPRKIQAAVKAGEAKPKANVSRFIEGKSGDVEGDTFYIGSPTSDRQFRAYNKAAEMGVVDGQAWLRLELELRRLRANGAFQSVAANGVDTTVAGHMGDFLNWGDMEYQAALSGQSIPPVDIPRRESNRRRWLTGQVAQALAKEMMLDDEFANVFWQHVQSEFARLQAD